MTSRFFAYLLTLNSLLIASWLLLWPHQKYLLMGLASVIVVLMVRAIKVYSHQQQVLIQSLNDGLLSLQDGDFATSLPEPKVAAAKPTVSLFNKAAAKLRQERQYLYQRELLLDKVINASSTLTVLVNDRDKIVFTNQAARHFFLQSNEVGDELGWSSLLQQRAPELQQITDSEQGCFVSMLDTTQQPQAWHLSRSRLRLHGQRHELFIFKPMTDELNRKELHTWKKVVRVMNHELNNSLAPISSMCHSGMLLAEKFDEPRLNKVFSTISRRIAHLADFIKDYSALARIREPNKIPVDALSILETLQGMYNFELVNNAEHQIISADPQQLEQVLINLLKNAHEAEPEQQVSVIVNTTSDRYLQIIIADKGPGMTADILAKALTPGFSTKPSGSGIGLSLCREIIDGHNGRLSLRNGMNKGLEVQLYLPMN
ncbi:histidine kinase [Neiella marina]|uniref:histidine kinase n=1 Tax=Neiella holothuriorum TaxID=2870530 RepID=A0ABS7EE51_9GAMM|nr:ATP-binding protein [Neiella holothuriorum]MBW8190499.1 histidine kinase [Neiella holothuriorum]